jgi:hypothetical protein
MAHRRGLGAVAGIGLELVATAAAALGVPAPVWIGVIVVGTGMLVYVAFLYLFRREPPVTESGKGDQIRIETQYQSGGTNIGKVVINAPKAGVRPQIDVANSPIADGKYLTRAFFNVDDRYAAYGLQVEAHGTAISGGAFQPEARQAAPGVTSVKTHELSRTPDFPHSITCSVGAPLARRYVMEVITDKPDDVSFDVSLDT